MPTFFGAGVSMALQRGRVRVTRDSLVVVFALGLAVYEIIWGGARPAVLTFLAAMLASPLVMRVDEARKPETEQRNDPPTSR
jgi:hypothetical protein